MIEIPYAESDLVRIAKRENNTKRNYLVVDPLQGKHIPVSPTESLKLFETLGKQVKESYPGERLLFVGFAETATAIGAGVAAYCGGHYMTTTRETIPGAEYLFFSEEHSHATAQKLVKNDLDRMADQIDRIVFVEDEVTTGKTILNIIVLLEKEYPGIQKYSVASLLNGMNEAALDQYQERGICLHYLVKTNHDSYPQIAEQYTDCRELGKAQEGYHEVAFSEEICEVLPVKNYENARRMSDTESYEKSVQSLLRQVSHISMVSEAGEVLVLGTEEFMYPAMRVGAFLEGQKKRVKFHATTRSPIAVCEEDDYPLKARYELVSLYEEDRRTFIYNLKKYECVLILTDAAPICQKGLMSLLAALRSCGNDNITVLCWEENDK